MGDKNRKHFDPPQTNHNRPTSWLINWLSGRGPKFSGLTHHHQPLNKMTRKGRVRR